MRNSPAVDMGSVFLERTVTEAALDRSVPVLQTLSPCNQHFHLLEIQCYQHTKQVLKRERNACIFERASLGLLFGTCIFSA